MADLSRDDLMEGIQRISDRMPKPGNQQSSAIVKGFTAFSGVVVLVAGWYFSGVNKQLEDLRLDLKDAQTIDAARHEEMDHITYRLDDIQNRKMALEAQFDDHKEGGHPSTVISSVSSLGKRFDRHTQEAAHPVANAQIVELQTRLSEIETQMREERGIRYQSDAAIRAAAGLPTHEYLPKGRDTNNDND